MVEKRKSKTKKGEERKNISIFAEIIKMRVIRYTCLMTLAVCWLLLTACNEGNLQSMPMQQSMDSLKMWYGKMERDSMDADGTAQTVVCSHERGLDGDEQ